MLATSPVLRKPEPPANTGNTTQCSPRYGSRSTNTQSPSSQSALVYVPTNSMTFPPRSPQVARPSASSHCRSDYHEDSNEPRIAARDERALPSSSTGQSHSTQASSRGPERTIEHNVPSGSSQRPSAQNQAQSPSIKRRQPTTPPANTDASCRTAAAPAPLKRPKTDKKELKVLPTQYELCAVEDIVILIADMIAELIQTNDNLPLQDGVLTRFHSRLVASALEHQNLLTNSEHHQESQ